MHRTANMIILTVISCLAGQAAVADVSGHSDAEVKAQFAKARTFRHAEFISSSYRLSFEMADCDTNRYARILREIAVENTNETRRALQNLGIYKTSQSLPFLYSYATNATYGADALKAIFAIEGVTSNSLAVTQGYLLLTNVLPNNISHDRSMLCKELMNRVFSSDDLSHFRQGCIDMIVDFARYRNSGHVSIDGTIQSVDPSYHASKRRLAVLRAAQNRCGNSFQLNYVTNAINELVAYPEAALPD